MAISLQLIDIEETIEKYPVEVINHVLKLIQDIPVGRVLPSLDNFTYWTIAEADQFVRDTTRIPEEYHDYLDYYKLRNEIQKEGFWVFTGEYYCKCRI